MFTETKYQHSSSKFIKSQPLFSQYMSKLIQTEKIITNNGWLFNKFAGGIWKFQIWLRFFLSVHTLARLGTRLSNCMNCIVQEPRPRLCIVEEKKCIRPTGTVPFCCSECEERVKDFSFCGKREAPVEMQRWCQNHSQLNNFNATINSHFW